jgi:hypothetical protein
VTNLPGGVGTQTEGDGQATYLYLLAISDQSRAKECAICSQDLDEEGIPLSFVSQTQSKVRLRQHKLLNPASTNGKVVRAVGCLQSGPGTISLQVEGDLVVGERVVHAYRPGQGWRAVYEDCERYAVVAGLAARVPFKG